MPAEIVWSRLSRLELVEIADFIAIESPKAVHK